MIQAEQPDPYEGIASEAIKAHATRRIKGNWRFIRYFFLYFTIFGLFVPASSLWLIDLLDALMLAFMLVLLVVPVLNRRQRVCAEKRILLFVDAGR